MKKELIDFIRYAKRKSYASNTAIEIKTRDGGRNYLIKKGSYTYTDKYFGSLVDSGQERVYSKGKVIWVMAYRGGIVQEYEKMSKKAFGFLKKCISKAPNDFPARGPKELIKGDFRYENKWNGEIDSFVGEENIYYKNKKICFRNYLGGLIKNKE